jgi:Tfp pilus assembly protein PilF
MNLSRAQSAQRAGKLNEAQELYRQALKSRPKDPEIHYQLAVLLVQCGQLQEAIRYFGSCAKLAPGNADVLNSLGNAQRLNGQLAKAGKNIERALKAAPGHPGVLCNRGWLHHTSDKIDLALEDFKRATDKAPQMADAWRGLGECLLAKGKWRQAQQALVRCLEIAPDSADALNTLGTLHVRTGQQQRALEYFEQALAQQPMHAETLINHGITCEQVGKLAQAEASLLRAIEARPGFPQAYFHLAHLATHESTAAEIAAMEQALAMDDSAATAINLGFALGKAHAKQHQYEQAFPYFQLARKHLQQQQSFSLSAEQSRIRSILNTHSSVAAPQQPSGSDLLFIVGMPRSGTTLTEQILASHSQVQALGESGLVGQLLAHMNSMVEQPYPQCWDRLNSSQKNALAAAAIGSAALSADKDLLVDTTPGNFLYLGLLSQIFPRARFVQCQRDARDTCLSIFEHPLSRAHAYANSLESLADYHLLYDEAMKHWQTILGMRLHIHRYESLVDNPEASVRALLTFSGLPYEQSCLQFHETQRTITTASASQVRQALNSASVGRWRNYEKFLEPLTKRLESTP